MKAPLLLFFLAIALAPSEVPKSAETWDIGEIGNCKLTGYRRDLRLLFYSEGDLQDHITRSACRFQVNRGSRFIAKPKAKSTDFQVKDQMPFFDAINLLEIDESKVQSDGPIKIYKKDLIWQTPSDFHGLRQFQILQKITLEPGDIISLPEKRDI